MTMLLQLQAASGRRHPRVPANKERALLLWFTSVSSAPNFASCMTVSISLQAASGRRHLRVPAGNERQILWVVVERPWQDMHGRFYYRTVIDTGGEVCWPDWRRVYQDTVELLSPSRYPVRVLSVSRESLRYADRMRRICDRCGRVFRRVQGRLGHEWACGVEAHGTLVMRRYEAVA